MFALNTQKVCAIDNQRICDSFAVSMEMEIYRQLGLAIAARRAELGITQADVAAKIGLTRASLANIETGRQKVMLHHVYRILEALKLKSILDLLPARFVFAESAEPVNFAGSAVSENQKIQLEQFIRLAGKR